MHPYLSYRVIEQFQVNASIPLSERKKIVYLSRSQGGELRNGGREIINEDQLLKSIRKLLQKRKKGEELVLFDHTQFKSLKDTMNYLSRNALAVIGPHGGAFNGIQWCSEQTLIIEFMPSNRFGTAFWELGSTVNHDYWVMVLNSLNDRHDMKVPISDVIEILKERLGLGLSIDGDSLRPHLNWRGDDIMETVNVNQIASP